MPRHFDLLAPYYDRAVSQPESTRLVELLRLPADGWLLDAGGGTGRIARLFQDEAGRCVVVDLSAPMLWEAQANGAASPVQATSERLPFADELFDRVVVVDALHHFANQALALSELARVTKAGGRIVVAEPDIRHTWVKLMALGEKLALMRSHFHTPAHIQLMLVGAGLAAQVVADGHGGAWIVGDKPDGRAAGVV
jgi:demethylmenaquinone methyltransferase/2-methoxy-6-polyprenyl-1,4-benzoquinol methylase